MISNCCDIPLPQLNINCCDRPIGNIQSTIFIKISDCISDDNGTFVRMKRKYGKYTRPIYKTNKPKVK